MRKRGGTDAAPRTHCEIALEESGIMIIKAMPNEQHPVEKPS
jgi:hypothetical protein